ncbi:MAG: hypothetical protein TREMPRED_000233 [Tremellales sp. Tagirdzhanova-0007]|nr:MAG: hypothetical protein TREMPRED_000233 [Tremellales sp. Tagirdzhanova-0007]
MSSAKILTPLPYPREVNKMFLTRDPSLRVRQAVRDNKVSLLQRLQHKTDLRNTDRNRLTSLSWSAMEGSLQVFEWLLLDYGHDDQELSRDTDNNTILHLLASIPSPPAHLNHSTSSFPIRPSMKPMAEQIAISLRMTQLYHTVFPFVLDWSNSGGKTALHVAAQAGNYSFISRLCDLGADVNLSDLQGNTPLHYASAWGHVETIKVLLERGCEFAARNFEGYTASDFSYSNAIMGALQRIAREVLEERRTRRKEPRSESWSEQGRLRSGSATSNASFGSGGSSNLAPPKQAFPFPEVRSAPQSRRPSDGQISPGPLPSSTYSSPASRPGQLVQFPSRASPNPQPSSPHAYSSFDIKPTQVPHRSPSMPSDPSLRPNSSSQPGLMIGLGTSQGPPVYRPSPMLGPPSFGSNTLSSSQGSATLPVPGQLGSTSMRRGNSGQTGSSAGSGGSRAAPGNNGRGTPI